MFTIRSWSKHQSAIIGKATWQRNDRIKKGIAPPETATNPLSIQSINVACVFDENFAFFAAEVGGAVAESYLIRTLQYAANGHALDGAVLVPRDKFGPIVLSRSWDLVNQKIGEKVYDAILSSGIGTPHKRSTGRSSEDRREDHHEDPREDHLADPPEDPLVQHAGAPAGARPLPVSSVPDLPNPPSPPSLPPNGHGNGGGVSASPPHGEGNGTAKPVADADPLSSEDEAVATTIIRLLRASDDPLDRGKAEKAFVALRDRTGTPGQARHFIDNFTARFLEDVTKTRRPFAMARNGRKKP